MKQHFTPPPAGGVLKKHNKKGQAATECLMAGRHIWIAASLFLMIAAPVAAQVDHIQAVITTPPALKQLNSPEVFGPDTLYEKIDGQAELYLSAGFVRLKSQWFANAQNTDAMFEVYFYHMGNELNAFSVYSAQRGDDARPVDLTRFAYQTENSLFLVHGPFYVEMIAASPSEKLLPEMKLLAQNFINDTPVESKTITEVGLFPTKNLDQDSIALIAKNAFGFGGLDQVFAADYYIDGHRVTAFVSKRKTTQEAKDQALNFYKYLKTFGSKDPISTAAVKDAKMIEIMDTFDIVFFLDVYVAGVHEAYTKTIAEKLAKRLAQTLRETTAAR